MKLFFPYAATTEGITVRVNPRFLPEQSDPAGGRFVWSYHVRIENGSARPVQLIARHWVITDGHGRVEEIEGPGVVGDTPHLAPGEAYDYVSGCPLATPSGTMRGSYAMVAAGELFDVDIPQFALDSPHVKPTLH